MCWSIYNDIVDKSHCCEGLCRLINGVASVALLYRNVSSTRCLVFFFLFFFYLDNNSPKPASVARFEVNKLDRMRFPRRLDCVGSLGAFFPA